jgi:hypothetical protein
MVDSLKALDPERPIREADCLGCICCEVGQGGDYGVAKWSRWQAMCVDARGRKGERAGRVAEGDGALNRAVDLKTRTHMATA